MPDTQGTAKKKQAVEKSTSSDEEFRALFERSPIAKIRFDIEGYPIEMNDAAVALVGVPDVTAISHIGLFSTPRISDADKERCEGEAIRYEQRYDFDDIKQHGYLPTTRSGARYIDAHIIPLFTEAGVIKEYIGEFVDITERKCAEGERESIAKFPDENPNPILRLTPDGAVLFANEASTTLLPDGSSASASPFDQVRARAADAFRSGKVCTHDVTLGTKTFLLTLVPLTDEGYVNVYGTDITERKRVEEALLHERDRAQRYIDLIDLAQDAIVVRDLDHCALTWNKGAQRLFGWTAEEAIGRRMSNLTRAVYPVRFEEFHATLLAQGHWEGAVLCQTRNGTPLIVEHRFTVERDEAGAPTRLLSISSDVTTQREAQAALREAADVTHALNQQLRSANEALRVANETLEERVQERTEELASMNVELQTTNEELRQEIGERIKAEQVAMRYAHRTAALNEITHVINEAHDLSVLYERAVTVSVDQLGFESGLVAIRADTGYLDLKYAHNLPSEFAERVKSIHVDSAPYARGLYQQHELVLMDEALPDSESYRLGLRGAVVAIPFISEGVAIGHVSLWAAARRSFTPEERELFKTIGLEFGTAVAKLQAKEELSRELKVNSALARLSGPLLSLSPDPKAISLAILNEAKQLTGSKHGFMALIDPVTKDLVSYGHTEMMLNECGIPPEERAIRFPIGHDERYHALSTYAINERKGFFTNAPVDHSASTGTPEGHLALKQFLAVPALIGDEPVGEIALANPGRNYAKRDVEAVQRLAEVYALIVMRMRAEEQLRVASLYARSLIEASLDPLVTISAEGTITDVNKATEEETGFSRDELIGSDFSDYFTEPEKARKGYRQVFADGFVRDYPLAIRHKSGRITDVLYNATVYRNEAGDVQGVFAAARDITDRKRAEAAAREYTRQQEIISRVIKAGNEADDLQSALISMLDNAVSLTGFEGGAVYLLDAEGEVAELQYASGAEESTEHKHISRTHQHVARIYEGASSFIDDRRTVSPSGCRLGAAAIANIPLSSKGVVIGHYVVSSTTPHHFSAAERELLRVLGQQAGTVIARLQAEEAALQRTTMLDLAHDAIVMWDDHDRIIYWNHGAELLYGWTCDEALGMPIHNLLSTEVPEPLERIKSSLNEAGRWEGELVHTTRDGSSVTVESHMTLQRTLDGTPIATLEINNDITELKRYAERLEDLVEERTAQLKDAERLAGIGETAAMIGHDLRNPLQGLQYIVDLQKLRFERVPPEERGANDWKNEEGLFDRISEQVFYMDKIVADLQDYARPIAPELEKVAISTLINDVRASLPRTDHVKIISDVSDLVMTVDPHLVHRVFANLILNAIQAMPDGGTLTISASRFDNSVAINVHDTGVGIPEEMKDKLFLPLCTGKAKGTGLGLAVVKRVIDAHGGTITFESVEGEGTTFTVTLPAKVNEGAFDDWSC
jgi:PAS domain S-box-containing protein